MDESVRPAWERWVAGEGAALVGRLMVGLDLKVGEGDEVLRGLEEAFVAGWWAGWSTGDHRADR